jgi:hypothetical protein
VVGNVEAPFVICASGSTNSGKRVLRPRRRRWLRPAAGRSCRRRTTSCYRRRSRRSPRRSRSRPAPPTRPNCSGCRRLPRAATGGVHLADPELHGWQRPADRSPRGSSSRCAGAPDGSPFRGPGADRDPRGLAARDADRARHPSGDVRLGAHDGEHAGHDHLPRRVGRVRLGTRDLGVLAAAPETTVQGGLASLAFPLRYAGTTTPQADFSLAASSTLPGALFAVTPDSYLPPTDGSTLARVAIGVPAGARRAPTTSPSPPVSATARRARRPRSSPCGRLRPGVAGGRRRGEGTAARLRLTTILPTASRRRSPGRRASRC